MNNISKQVIDNLKKKKELAKHNEKLNKLNAESEKNYIDQQIKAQQSNEIKQKRQEVQKQNRKFIVAESKDLCRKIFALLKRCGVITNKQGYSACMGMSPNYWLMCECREEQGVSITALKELKDTLYQVKYRIDDILYDEDKNFTLWVKTKLETYIEELEKEIMKIMRLIYGIMY